MAYLTLSQQRLSREVLTASLNTEMTKRLKEHACVQLEADGRARRRVLNLEIELLGEPDQSIRHLVLTTKIILLYKSSPHTHKWQNR